MRLALLLVALLLASCSSCDDDTEGTPNSNTGTNVGTDSGLTDAGGDAGATDAGANNTSTDSGTNNATDGGGSDGGRIEFCNGNGPPLVPTPDGTLCTGDVAEVGFRFALCSCEGIASSNAITTSSINSASNMTGQSASVGTNGGFNANSGVDIGGSLIVSGENGITMSNDLDVSGNLEVGGSFNNTSATNVSGDAEVEGNVEVSSTLTVDGTLTQPAGANQNGTVNAGSTAEAAVDVGPPCDCEADQLLPIGQIIDSLTATNDNADIQLDSNSLQNVTEATTIDLPCGRFYLDEVGGTGEVTVNVTGRVALVIDGNLSLNGDFTVSLADGAELDLFVSGNVNLAGTTVLGDPDRPAATRVYVDGTGTINISSGFELNANLYAPRAEVAASGAISVRGAIFTRRLAASGAVNVVYDEAIQDVADDCPDDPNDPDDPDMCDSCRDCRNQACLNGVCGNDCQTSDDCCSPFICQAGECVVIQ